MRCHIVCSSHVEKTEGKAAVGACWEDSEGRIQTHWRVHQGYENEGPGFPILKFSIWPPTDEENVPTTETFIVTTMSHTVRPIPIPDSTIPALKQ